MAVRMKHFWVRLLFLGQTCAGDSVHERRHAWVLADYLAGLSQSSVRVLLLASYGFETGR
jgi:hypothetical protein